MIKISWWRNFRRFSRVDGEIDFISMRLYEIRGNKLSKKNFLDFIIWRTFFTGGNTDRHIFSEHTKIYFYWLKAVEEEMQKATKNPTFSAFDFWRSHSPVGWCQYWSRMPKCPRESLKAAQTASKTTSSVTRRSKSSSMWEFWWFFAGKFVLWTFFSGISNKWWRGFLNNKIPKIPFQFHKWVCLYIVQKSWNAPFAVKYEPQENLFFISAIGI